jgi:hypothetical protein
MLWWIGSGLTAAWVVLQLFRPRGWTPMMAIGGISLIIIQFDAYLKQKAVQ